MLNPLEAFVEGDRVVQPAGRDERAEVLARNAFRQFRQHADHHPDEPRTRELLARFATSRPELARWWECSSVGEFRTTSTPVDGRVWTFSLLRPSDAPESGVLLLSADGPN